MKYAYLILILILSINIASAAILHGTVYNYNLDPLNNVIVEVNSTPPQTFVSKEGQYSFVLDVGTYEVTARYGLTQYRHLFTQDNVTVERDGYFVKDLFLKPINPSELNESGQKIPTDPKNRNYFTNYILIVSTIVAVFIITFLFFLFQKIKFIKKPESKSGVTELQSTNESTNIPEKPELPIEKETQPEPSEVRDDKYVDDVLKVIDEEKGRTTQKDIRKKIPLSEAKISLIISELEEKGIVKKIKKGRGNIIILNK